MASTYARLLCASCALMFAAGEATPASAQSAASRSPASQSSTQGSEIEAVVVTARRREENIQATPVAVAAFSQHTLQEKSIYSAFDLNKAVPGLTVNDDAADIGKATFSIRGRGTTFGTASGSVETYFAEVPLSTPYNVPQLPPQFFDLNTIQVLKGPQGTLFGRDTTGGAVLIVPQAPTDQFGGYVRLQGGTHSDFQAEGAINIPLAGDKVMLRLAGFDWQRKGYARTIGGAIDFTGRVLPSVDFLNQDVKEFRATLLLKPIDNLTNSTIFTYHTDKNRYTAQVRYARPNSAFGPPILASDPKILSIGPRLAETNVDINRPASDIWAIINTTAYEVSSDLALKNIFGYIYTKGYDLFPSDVDGSTFPGIDLLRPPRPMKNFQTTDELQLQGKAFDDRLTYTVGGLIDLTRQPGGHQMNIATSSLQPPGNVDYKFAQSTFTSEAIYASVTYKLTDAVSLSGGVRNTWDDVKYASCEYFAPLPTLPLRSDACEAAQIAAGEPAFLVAKKRFSGLTYDLGLEYRPDADVMVYGGYRHGYKRGGFVATGGGANQIFGPETVNDFYAGTKLSLAPLNLRGHFNIEGFYDFYKGAQRPYSSLGAFGLLTLIQNVPGSIYRGFDTDFVVEATDWLTVSGSYTFLDAYWSKWPDISIPGVPGDLTVNPVGLLSRNKVSVTARFHHDFGAIGEFAVAPTLSYQSKFYDEDNAIRQPNLTNSIFGAVCAACDGASTIPGYSVVDLRVELNKVGGSNVDLALNVNNLFNKVYAIGGTGLWRFGFDDVIYGPPRMVTFEARAHF